MTAETCLPAPISAAPAKRHQTIAVSVGGVIVGGGAPIVVQSMTNTDTADIDGTVQQVAALVRAGSELVRITVDRDEAAAAGTAMHYDIECYYNQCPNNNTSVEYEYFKQFLEDYPHLEPYRTEWTIFHEELRLSGSIDMVFRNKKDGTFSIYDWKRCREIK